MSFWFSKKYIFSCDFKVNFLSRFFCPDWTNKEASRGCLKEWLMTFSVKMLLFATSHINFHWICHFQKSCLPLISGQKSKMRTKKFRKCGQKSLFCPHLPEKSDILTEKPYCVDFIYGLWLYPGYLKFVRKNEWGFCHIQMAKIEMDAHFSSSRN